MLKDKHKDEILKVGNRIPYLEKLSFKNERKIHSHRQKQTYVASI